MNASDRLQRRCTRLVPFAYGFRPFFLLAGWFAAGLLGVWLWLFQAGALWTGGLPAFQWHGHEMLFGFVTAAIAGFMLTAVPSWTGSRGFAGWPLVSLTIIWMLGRAAFLLAGRLPPGLVVALELAFLPALAALVAPSLLRTRNRNTLLLLVLLVLWITDAVFLRALYRSDPALAGASLLFALNLVLLLITVIGGRIVPAFTGNALKQKGVSVRMRREPVVEYGVIATMIGMLIVDALLPGSRPAGIVALAAGLLQAVRLAGWNGHRTWREPIVWILHVAYAWLPAGLLLKAASLLGGIGWAAYWMHALGAGAAATMILAVMSRASLGHTGRPLRVAPIMTLSYVLLVLSTTIRVFGPASLSLDYRVIIILSGALWIGAFLVYAIVYTPVLLRPRVDGKPG